MGLDMAREFKIGQMGQSTRGTGRTIWLMGTEDLSMRMEMSMKESG
jgi:hypothetical protein